MSEHIRRGMLGALIIGAAHFVLTASGYVIAIVLARGLGPAEYGSYGVIYSLLVAAELAVQFGVPVAVSRLIAESPSKDRELAGVGLTIVLMTYTLVFAITWISAPQLASTFQIPNGAPLFRIAALDLPFYGAYLLLENVLGGRRDFASKSAALLAYALTKLVGVITLAAIGLSVQGAFIVNVLASLVALVIVYMKVGHTSIVVRTDVARTLLKIAVPTAMIDAGTQILLYSDLWLIGLLSTHVDPKIQGYYVAAKNLARAPMMVSLALNSVLVPSLAHATAAGHKRDAERFIHGTTRFLAVALIPGCTLVAVNAEPIMSLIFSTQYAAGGLFLSLLIFGSGLLFTVFSVLLNILLAIGKQRLAAAISLCSVAPALIANWILVPRFGAAGAGMATIIASVIAVAATAVALHRTLGSLIDVSILPKVILGTALVCLLANYIDTRGLLVIVELVAMASLFAMLCVPLRLVSKTDLALLRRK